MLKILYAGCLGLSLAISAQFTLKMCAAARNRKMSLIRIPYFGGLRSFKVIHVNILMKLVTSVCYDEQHVCDSVPICNRFHCMRANSSEIRTF